MKNFTKNCYCSSIIALLMLIALPMLVIEKTYAQGAYEEQLEFSEAELAQILAPIALYPDSLLTHILIASTYPLEIVQASRWRAKNKHLDANQAIKKAADKDWDPSIIALLAFPNVLERLSEDLDWTQKLGSAFLQDEEALLLSIQSLRQQAEQVNSLSEMDKMSVIHVNNQIIIEPAYKGILYVPYYDPRIVYGHWHWRSHPPVYWTPSPYYARRNHAHFYWGSGVQITFNYYFTSFNWHKRNVIVVNHHHSHVYRHRERIITSRGAHRWQHKPQPHYRVIERTPHVKQQDNRRYPSNLHSKKIQSNEHRQIIDNKTDRNRGRNNNQVDRQNKQPDRHLKGEQAIDSKLTINQQQNRRQLIEKKIERNRERNHSQIDRQENRRQLIENKIERNRERNNSQIDRQETRRQLIDNKIERNRERNKSPVDQQNKQQDRQIKSHQSIERRVKIDQQENRQSSHKEERLQRKIPDSAER